MVKISNCLECKQCCSFQSFAGKTFTEKMLARHFSFNNRLCNAFFIRKGNEFLLGSHCKQYNSGKCNIYNTDDFPFACAIYPFIIASKSKGGHKLLIDRNCPSWREVVNSTDELHETIKKYKETDSIDTFPEKDLIRMGYKVLTILKDIDI